MQKLDLPKKRIIEGEEFPYVSYSQHSSYKNPKQEFRNSMILNYIFNLKVESKFQPFADYGSACGEYIETKGEKVSDLLSQEDCFILDDFIKNFNPDSEYEREVWIEREGYHILGYIDRWNPLDKNNVNVEDFKTGAAKKVEEYSSEDYGQTTLYSYAQVLKGNVVNESFVTLLVRKGNPISDKEEYKTPCKLTGEIIKIPTPYSKKRIEKLLREMDETAKDLAELKKIHKILSETLIEF